MKPGTRKITSLLSAVLISLLFSTAAMAEKQTVRVSAAANLTEALKKIGERFNRIKPDVELQFNFGSSGALAKQIDNGAPTDLFFSASPKWMDHLVETKKVVKDTVRDVTCNSLVVVSVKASPLVSLADVAGFKRIAMGSPKSVPVGEYTEQALTAAGIYDSLTVSGKLIMTQDVRQALLYADRGEADAAFVYKTDALLAGKAKIVFTVPAKLHKPIVSNMGLTVDGGNKSGAKAFYDYMSGKEAKAVFESFGYVVIVPPGTKNDKRLK